MSTLIVNRVAQHAADHGSALAVHLVRPGLSDLHLTYADLESSATHIARLLGDCGVGPGAPVKVALSRGPALVVALLAIWKTGAYYVPIPADSSTRADRIASHFDNCVLVSDPTDPDSCLPDVSLAGDNAKGPIDPALAYVMFTSGSTGQPKGVLISSTAVERLVLDSEWDDGHHRDLGMLAPHAFQLSTYEIWVPLTRGGTIVMAPDGPLDLRVLGEMCALLQDQSIHLTAGLFRLVAGENPGLLRGLYEVATGGDVISPTAVAAVLENCPGTRVRTIYGCTEAVLFTSTRVYGGHAGFDRITVGHPFAGSSLRVADEHLQRLPSGEVGEVCIGGDRLAIGYLSEPGMTAERFVNDPERIGAQIYRTGDVGRIDGNGELILVGRRDRQIKIRGFRVELREVEAALEALPGVSDVAVATYDSATGDARMVAFVTGDVTPLAVRRSARNVLPTYMIPERVRIMDRLPVTENGKIDWTLLEEIQEVLSTATTQAHICRVFTEILELGSEAQPDDDFFDLGGQSLTAMRVAAALSESSGTRVAARDVFDAPTPSMLCSKLAAGDRR